MCLLTNKLHFLACFHLLIRRLHTFSMSSTHNNQQQLSEKGHGVRSDVMLIWEELDKARNVLFDVNSLISDIETGRFHKGNYLIRHI